jgi:hypothetical protein
MKTRKILMCGGPVDGRWVAVEPDARCWHAVEMPPGQERWKPGPVDPQGPMPQRVTYDIRPVMILGHELWIGVCENEAYDDRAVLRAIFQLDVAVHLGAYR